MGRVRDEIRFRHYSIRTEQAYVDWISRFILFHDKRHPTTMGSGEIKAFLEHLALQRHVAANTQNQAFNALLFLYREILHQDFALGEVKRAKLPERTPTVLTREEVQRLLDAMEEGAYALMARLLYGTGMRIMECVRLRVKDVDF